MASVDSLLKQLQKQQDAANKANEKRYTQLLKQLRDTQQQSLGTYSEAMGEVRKLGKTRESDIQRDAVRQGAAAEQDLISRGLGNTTIRSSVQRGVEEDRQRSLNMLAEMLAGQRAGVLQDRAGLEAQLGGQIAGAIERRSDIGPDTGLYAGLIQQLARAEQASQPTNVRVGARTPTTPLRDSLRGGFGGGGASGGGSGGGASNPAAASGNGAQSGGAYTVTNPGGQRGGGGVIGSSGQKLGSKTAQNPFRAGWMMGI